MIHIRRIRTHAAIAAYSSLLQLRRCSSLTSATTTRSSPRHKHTHTHTAFSPRVRDRHHARTSRRKGYQAVRVNPRPDVHPNAQRHRERATHAETLCQVCTMQPRHTDLPCSTEPPASCLQHDPPEWSIVCSLLVCWYQLRLVRCEDDGFHSPRYKRRRQPPVGRPNPARCSLPIPRTHLPKRKLELGTVTFNGSKTARKRPTGCSIVYSLLVCWSQFKLVLPKDDGFQSRRW
jgi:hypothetical protein